MATQYTAGLSSGQVLTAATMNSIGAAWETWTPAITASTTNPTLGTGGGTSGRYGRINKTVFGNLLIAFGTSGTAQGTGFYFVSLPVTAQGSGAPIGVGTMLDSSTSTLRNCVAVLDSTSRMALWLDNTTNFAVAATNPWTWSANDFIRVTFQYEAG